MILVQAQSSPRTALLTLMELVLTTLHAFHSKVAYTIHAMLYSVIK